MSVPSHFGRYRVLRALAAGEMGTVYLAEDPLIGRQVAIKGLKFDPRGESDELHALQARFEQEIQIAGTFSHPNIVTLFDVGRQDGRTFIAMEYVDGRTLRAELKASGPLPYDAAIDIGVPMCRALSYAHDRGVIHRDVKPTNIMLTADAEPKITDFGVARLAGSTLTRAGKIFGTPAYMSPEQAMGGKLTGASDQFSAAAVIYEMLTGQRPFRGESPTSVIYKVIEDDPTPPEELNPLVPHRVSRAVMRGLDKRPERRFASCAEFADELEEALEWARENTDAAFLVTRPPTPAATSEPGPADWLASSPVSGEFLAANLERLADIVRAIAVSEPARAVVRTVKNRPRTLAVVAIFGAVLIGSAWALSSHSSGLEQAPPRVLETETGARLPEMAGAAMRATSATPLRASYGAPGDLAPGALALQVAEAQTVATEPEGPLEAEATPAVDDLVSFRVTSRPAGARVVIDGQPADTSTPVAIEVAASETHRIRLNLEGYKTLLWSFNPADLTEQHLSSGVLHFPLKRSITGEELSSRAVSEPLIGPVYAPDGRSEVTPPPEAETEEPPAAFDLGAIRRVRAPGDTPLPSKTRHVDPELPQGARASGMVVLEIEVSSRGNVVQAKVVRGLQPALDRAALDAVIRWKYEPTLLAGEPVHVRMTVSVPFSESRF